MQRRRLQVAGIDFLLHANDPAFIGTQTSGGRIAAGTNDLFAPNSGFVLPFPSSFQVFGATAGAEVSIGDTPELGATLTLDTTGATVGGYSMVMSSVLAVDARFLTVPLQGAAPLSYTIAARQLASVPEPASGALAALALLAACTLRRAPPARCG